MAGWGVNGMDLGYIGWALGLLAMCSVGILIIKFSKRFVDWVLGWSIPFHNKINKSFGIPNQNIEEQRKLATWFYRAFGMLICVLSLTMLIWGTINQLSK